MHKRIGSVSSRLQVLELPLEWRIEGFKDLIDKDWDQLRSPPIDVFPECCHVKLMLQKHSSRDNKHSYRENRRYELIIKSPVDDFDNHLRDDRSAQARMWHSAITYYLHRGYGRERAVVRESYNVWSIKLDETRLLEDLNHDCLELRLSLQLTRLVES